MSGPKDDTLARLDAARQLLEQVKDPVEIRDLRDKAAALELYLRHCRQSHDLAFRAAEIKVRCERKLGELFGPSAPRGRPAKIPTGGNYAPPPDVLPSQQVTRLRRIAQIPADEFDCYLETLRAEGLELTTAGVLRLWRALYRPQANGTVPDEVQTVPDGADAGDETPDDTDPDTVDGCLKTIGLVLRRLREVRDLVSALVATHYGQQVLNAAKGHNGCTMYPTGRTVQFGRLGPLQFGPQEYSCDAMDELLGLCGSLKLLFGRTDDDLPQPGENGRREDPYKG